jgi:NADH-quinone oxidoreductase subunit C
MITALSGKDLAAQLSKVAPGSVVGSEAGYVVVNGESLLPVMTYLKQTPELDFAYFNYVTAVDYFDYFEVIYQLTSLTGNRSVVVKTRCDRENPVLPSVVSLWQGADFQEREVFDLMGIRFEGHPNLKRILLWEGFPGHPLRKDFLG